MVAVKDETARPFEKGAVPAPWGHAIDIFRLSFKKQVCLL